VGCRAGEHTKQKNIQFTLFYIGAIWRESWWNPEKGSLKSGLFYYFLQKDSGFIMSDWVVISRETINENIEDMDVESGINRYLNAFIDSLADVKGFKKLDFGITSLNALDTIIDELWGADGPSEESSVNLVATFGAYVCKVLEKNVDGVWWTDGNEPYFVIDSSSENALCLLPFSWVQERMYEGGDSLSEKFEAVQGVVADFKRDPAQYRSEKSIAGYLLEYFESMSWVNGEDYELTQDGESSISAKFSVPSAISEEKNWTIFCDISLADDSTPDLLNVSAYEFTREISTNVLERAQKLVAKLNKKIDFGKLEIVGDRPALIRWTVIVDSGFFEDYSFVDLVSAASACLDDSIPRFSDLYS